MGRFLESEKKRLVKFKDIAQYFSDEARIDGVYKQKARLCWQPCSSSLFFGGWENDPGRHVTPDQAMQISQGVKAVAIAYGKQTMKNEFGAVYGELYRKEGVTS